MTASAQLANRFRAVILNGKMVANTNLKAQLSDVKQEEATTKVGQLNTLALLTFHLHYYIAGVLNVFNGGTLDIRDRYSFDLSPLESEAEWEKLAGQLWSDAEKFAEKVEQMTDEKLAEAFTDEKYGTYQQNIDMMIEHCYYHLGQIVLIKKMIRT